MILVYMEIRENDIKKSSLEALSEAKRRADEMGTEVGAAIVGHNLENMASKVFPYGAQKLIF